ncbi:MAG: PIN domain-containing protein [Caldilineaceae bacterium]
MTIPFVDTDVIIRLLTGDDPVKQAQAVALFEEVEQGKLTLAAPDTVIADAVFVLASPRLYRLPRAEVAALLTPLVQLSHFRLQNRNAVLAALSLYGSTNGLDFGDALIVAAMQEAGSQTLYSYDSHFDRIPGLIRQEPRG